jgi:hypothetical protein
MDRPGADRVRDRLGPRQDPALQLEQLLEAITVERIGAGHAADRDAGTPPGGGRYPDLWKTSP